MNHMHQVGLIPAKKVREEPVTINPDIPIPVQFLRRLEDLEKEVRQLQNKNRALEESYKKLNDLVEAQNHLLTNGGTMMQRMPMPACTPQQTREDCVSIPAETQPTDRKVIATASIPSYVTSHSDTITMTDYTRVQSSSPVSAKQNGVIPFELPRRVSAREVLHLWEYGCDDFPPLKDWTPTQKLRQQSKISRWKKLVDIFQNGYGGDWSKFEKSFSDSKGEVLPVTTILSLFETQQTPAFLLSNTPTKENGAHSPPRYEEERPPRLYIDDDSQMSDTSLDSHKRPAPEQAPRENTPIKADSSVEIRYTLPRKVTPKDIVHLWENGCEDFPPVGAWSRAQRIGQETKIFRWKKIVDIFNSDSHRNWDYFDRKYCNERGLPLPISAIISKYDAEHVVQGPVFDKIEPRRNSVISSFTSSAPFNGSGSAETVIVKAEHTMEPVEVKIEIPNLGDAEDVFSFPPGQHTFGPHESLGSSGGESGSSLYTRRDDRYILPRKVTAKDVIKMWETGYGDIPPLSTWSPAQKSGQRSKFSRWAKIYDIYKYRCNGNMEEFERTFTDEKGELLPITTIVAMHDARDTGSSSSMCFSPTGVIQEAPDGTKIELYQLPRKVSAKDVVQLWEEGCDRFPPVSTWPKIHRVGHETKLFRWKKIVDIFRKDCAGSWPRFEERFSNVKGELLPISAILAKYDLENEPVTYYKPMNLNGSVSSVGSVGPVRPLQLDKPTLVGPTMADIQDLNTNQTESADDDSVDSKVTSPTGLHPAPEFILPKRVSALDVIYFWENGLGDMPPVCQWTPQQKASQRSKISRWNKIVDIFKYECGGDIRQFEEKYKDERGELMPITTIINLHDAQDKPWEVE